MGVDGRVQEKTEHVGLGDIMRKLNGADTTQGSWMRMVEFMKDALGTATCKGAFLLAGKRSCLLGRGA